jgi:5-methylcytosine-specific restriction protein A
MDSGWHSFAGEGVMARLEFSRKVRAAIISRANGKCEACSAVLKPGEGDVDHILPDALGGKPEASNGRWICKPCHREKTADDIKRIRKSDRQRDRHTGAIAPAGNIQSPGFAQVVKPQRASRHDWIAPLPKNKLFEAKP